MEAARGTLDSDAGSRPETAFDVEQLFDLVRRHALLIVMSTLLAMTLAAVFVLLQKPVYRATAELLVAPQTLQVVGRDIVRTDSSTSLELANVDSQALVILSTSVLRQVADKLGLAVFPEFQPHVGLVAWLTGSPSLSESQRESGVLDLLKQSVVIHRVDNALVFQITVSSPDAARAAEIANALAAAYLQETALERVEAVKRANGSIIAQVSGLRDQLDVAEAAVERYRSENGLIRSSDSGLVVTQQLNAITTQIDAAGAEVSRLAARKEQVAKIGPEALLTDIVPDVLNSSTLIALRAQYAQIAREAASQSRTLLPQHPHMLELRAELDEGQKQLQAELTRIRASVADSYAQAVNNLKKLQARAKDLTSTKVASSEAETKLRQLDSEAEAIRAVLNASLNRARELDQQGRIETNNSHVLTQATAPVRPSNPPLPIVLAAAALFGTCVGIGIAYLMDVLSRRSRSPRMTVREAARLLGVDTVVSLPALGRFGRNRQASEDLRALLDPVAFDLRASLRHRLPALVVVAAARGAGRMQGVAEHIGQGLADLGEEVLLCDGWTAPDDLEAIRIEARGPAASAKRRSATRDMRPEFIVTAVDLGQPASARPATVSADAVVLAVDLARVSPDALLAAARLADPSRRRIVALLALNAPAGVRRSQAQGSMVETVA